MNDWMAKAKDFADLKVSLKIAVWAAIHVMEIKVRMAMFSSGKIAWDDPCMAPVRRAANWKWN